MAIDRRHFLATAFATAASGPTGTARGQETRIVRPIARGAESVPAIGMGTWLTFAVGDQPTERAPRAEVLRRFLDGGGTLIDSSPMYGSAEEVVGDLLAALGRTADVFSATKVWTSGRLLGERQMYRSLGYWGLRRFDLVQVHNLLDWETHLPLLREWRDRGLIRYVGVTTSHGRRHAEIESLMRREPLDFVQFSYSLADRSVEQRLLPLAADRGISVIANRPFDGGDLFDRVRGRALPGWAAEIGIANWAQLFLKFVIAHPAVTCAIPATSNPAHMTENMGALRGPLPDARTLRLMRALPG
jgi:diketogulonate reductase-like aldo/keto reductase